MRNLDADKPLTTVGRAQTIQDSPSSSTTSDPPPAAYRTWNEMTFSDHRALSLATVTHPQVSSSHRASDTAARLPADSRPTMEDFSDLFAMHFVTDDEVSDAAAAAARLPARSLEHQFVLAMMFQARGSRARGQPRDRQARSPAATSQAQPGRQVASVSHDAHLAGVRLHHVGAQRQQAYKLESKY
jgi:hypothetical protein